MAAKATLQREMDDGMATAAARSQEELDNLREAVDEQLPGDSREAVDMAQDKVESKLDEKDGKAKAFEEAKDYLDKNGIAYEADAELKVLQDLVNAEKKRIEEMSPEEKKKDQEEKKEEKKRIEAMSPEEKKKDRAEKIETRKKKAAEEAERKELSSNKV